MEKFHVSFRNTYYRLFVIYIAIIVSLIFGFQLYRYFVALPANEVCTSNKPSAVALIPVVGVFVDAA